MENINKKLQKYNQLHILNLLNLLEGNEKKQLEEQILSINFEQIKNIYEKIKKDNYVLSKNIKPINYINKQSIEQEKKDFLQKIGEEIIKNNRYAVVTMAGGQGTRLGFNGPKGTYKLSLDGKEKYIFEILVDTLKKSKEKYGVLPYWYIMTSKENNEETIRFFEKNHFFGYEKEKIKFFAQSTLPILTSEGKFVIENNKIKTGSNGNGGVYQALRDEKIIEDMKNKKIDYVYICGVDNIMVNPIDTVFLGLSKNSNVEIASKSVAKSYPNEKVGVFCKRDNKPSIVEYIELSDEMRNQINENNELAFGEANIVSHLFKISALEKLADIELNYHLAIKNNLYKFETFIFDGFEYFDDMLVMRVDRDKEFAPIKNKEGIDSPETAKKIYLNFYKKNIDL